MLTRLPVYAGELYVGEFKLPGVEKAGELNKTKPVSGYTSLALAELKVTQGNGVIIPVF